MSSLGMAPLRRDLVSVVAGQARLVLAPAIGGAVMAWTWGDAPIFRLPTREAQEGGGARDLACYPLFPFSGRVAGRKFRFAGGEYTLPALLGDWAIHGAGWQVPWQAEEEGERVTLRLDYPGGELWPFAFHAEQAFTLTEDALTIRCLIENRHDTPAPAAFGEHPFFSRSEKATLRFAAAGVQRTDADLIPIGHTLVPPEWDHSQPRAVGSVALDNCFTGWEGMARIDYPDRGYALDITADPVFANLVVYIPPGRDFLAVEPVANIGDALNRMDGTPPPGMFVLGPGESRRGSMRFSLSWA